jgi:RNA polymerase sigma-70 factor (ECF subfamily)
MSKTQQAHQILSEGLTAAERSAGGDGTQVMTRALAAGDETAWRDFFEHRNRRIRAYVLKVWQGSETAVDDIVQETFVRAAKYMKVFPDEESLWGWLTVLARSATADAGRKQGRFRRFLERFDRERPPRVALTDSDYDREGLATAMGRLPFGVAHLLRWKYEDGRSVQSIAGELSISAKAVESRLTRARAALRSELRDVR